MTASARIPSPVGVGGITSLPLAFQIARLFRRKIEDVFTL